MRAQVAAAVRRARIIIVVIECLSLFNVGFFLSLVRARATNQYRRDNGSARVITYIILL